MPLDPILRDVLDDYLEELRHMRIKLASVEKKMAAHTAQVHQAKMAALRSVPGVGRIVACSYLSELFRPERFERGEEVAAYLGLPLLCDTVEKRHRMEGFGLPGKPG